MVANDFRELGFRLMEPLVSRLNLNPAWLSLLSLVTAAAAGYAFYLAELGSWWLLGASLLVTVTAILDGLDGQVARRQGVASQKGDLLDHSVDRLADVLMLGGLAMGPIVDDRLGFMGIIGVLLLSYMGTQAQAVGAGRDYAGVLGRADRLFVMIVTPLVQYGLASAGYGEPYGWSIMAWMMALFAVVCTLSAGYRFVRVWQALDAKMKTT